MRFGLSTCMLLLVLSTFAVSADKEQDAKERPLRALLITGGCCHDYARQKLILTRGISARTDVIWTVVHQGRKTTNTKIPVYEDPNWAEGFDVVVHNECFSNVRDIEWVERILRPHREGVPAVLIHCAMHCYRTGDDRWFEFVGMQSPGHGPHYAYEVENIQQNHPIMAGFGNRWRAPKGELYHSIRVFPDATPLAHARRKSDGQPQICVWTNQYGKGRVFATTIGHYNATMAEPTYLDMVARGLLWSVGRLDESEIRATNQKTNDEIKALVTAPVAVATQPANLGICCGTGNLAFGKDSKASSEETGKNNFAKNASDGDLRTRWCAAGSQVGEWWQVDFGKLADLRSLRLHWEMRNAAYRYRVDASSDGESWKTIVDQSTNDKIAKITPHQVESPETRFLRVTFLGSSTGCWGSFWELEAYEGDLPELPAEIQSADSTAASPMDAQLVGTASEEFGISIFGSPPQVNYPVCLAAAPTGELFVGIDEQGSLGKQSGGGRVVRCVDSDGDGTADRVNTFAQMDHPRGLFYDAGSLWVLHPPLLSVFHDDDGDGTADRSETLVSGISTDLVEKRGADHTTNGIRMGIDGWLYIAVGDFGFVDAKGADGKTISRRGGGVVRVRPDGTEMEVVAWGLRNILDVCIDPLMNMFTRDNTNDGGGWDVRLSHIFPSGRYGYPSLYKNFADEILPPLADFGGGSGCGGMYLHDERWPSKFGDALYTCDWGRSEVYVHNLPTNGATFDGHQELFLKIPRPTDIDVDGSGRLYVSSWKNGQFKYSGPDVGFVVQIKPKNFLPKPFPDLASTSDQQLVKYLSSPSAVHRLHTQREILRRGESAHVTKDTASVSAVDSFREELSDLAGDRSMPPYARVAAIFTLKELSSEASHGVLLNLVNDEDVSEFAMRALTDRTGQLEGLSLRPFIEALTYVNPRIQAQALISLGRIGRAEAADAVLPFCDRKGVPATAQNAANPAIVIPHLAVQALVAMKATSQCMEALGGPHADGALRALRQMHDPQVVDGLIKKLSATRENVKRVAILSALIRLYHREGAYRGDWWGTRPDTTGPYYDRKAWQASARIGQVVRTAVLDSTPETAEILRRELARHRVTIPNLPNENNIAQVPDDKPIQLPALDPENSNQIGNLKSDVAAYRALSASGDPTRGKALFTQQSCIACHTVADGQTPKGPHLVDIGKRYKREELIESVLKPSAKIAQGFETHAFITVDGRVTTGFIVSESADTIHIRKQDGVGQKIKKATIEEEAKQRISMMPEGLVNNLTPEQLADLLAYIESLE